MDHKSSYKIKKRKCKYCRKAFERSRELRRHVRYRKRLECAHCNKKYCTLQDLQKHLRSINKSISGVDLNTAINPSSGYEGYKGYHEVIERNINRISDRERVYKKHKVLNHRIDSSFTYRELYNLLEEIYITEATAFKINLGFGFMLYNIIEEEFKYYYNSTNNLLFEHAFTISNQQNVSDFFNKVVNLDLLTNYYLKKPSSSYVLCGLINLEVFIFPIQDTLIGTPTDLPKFIKQSKSIISLTHHKSPTYRYIDNRCFFRCLSIHHGLNTFGLEKYTKKLLSQFESYHGKSLKNGVSLNDIPNLEVFFHVSINIYALQQNGTADVIYLSRLPFKPLYLNLHKKHFSYIKHFTTFAKKFQCQLCKRLFNRNDNLKHHQEKCNTEVKEIFCGGKYFNSKNIFERLEYEGINVSDRYYKYISTWDFETIQVPIKGEIHGRSVCYEHVPASFSICSNIPQHTKPIHKVSNGQPQELVDELVKIQLQHQEAASQLMRKKYTYIIEKFERELERFPENIISLDGELKNRYKRVRSLLSSLVTYCDQLILVGFNSQCYDIPLIRKYLPSSLQRFDTLPRRVIKKGNAYMCISTKRLKYLDLTNYLAPGTSLESLYKSYSVKTPKGLFPYQWFDSLQKLKKKKLPSRKKFHNVLTNSTISRKMYNQCKEVWNQHKMKNFGEYLMLYNNSDVTGLVEAVEKMIQIEIKNGLDLFKESISLPGITQRYLFKNLKNDYFVGIGREHSHIYKHLKDGVTGGPSIIFHRMHIAGETRIKNKDLCQKVIGYDANSLYLWCMAQYMPTGIYSLREKTNNFKKATRYSKQGIQWLSYLNQERGRFIQHAENSIHGEVRIENYIVDGFEEDSNTIFEFYGCYFHGHFCSPKYDIRKWEETMRREEDLRGLGYKLVSITSCQWIENKASKIWYSFKELSCSYTDILQSIMNDKIFGIVKCSLHVPENLIQRFSEFPPLFKNTEITIADIGEHMQEYCRKAERKKGVKRSLISSMWAKGIVMLTPLLKKYIEMGLVITDIEFVMEYNPKRCFKWFQDEVVFDRRMADLNPDWEIRGQTSKCKGNYNSYKKKFL